MLFTAKVETDGDHRWAVVHCSCDIADPKDALIASSANLVREAYGYQLLVARLAPDPLVGKTFDMSAVLQAFNMGLPDAEEEMHSAKPAHLTNYRSETMEFVARGALTAAFGIQFPTHPQRGKTNANQPVLGFDGWGVTESNDAQYSLVLVQVKGTEDTSCPPREATTLAHECKEVLNRLGTICRALTVMVLDLDPSPVSNALLQMMEDIGSGVMPVILVAPVIVRGTIAAQSADLDPIKPACRSLAPSAGRGVSVSIGVPLNEFGRRVMNTARAA